MVIEESSEITPIAMPTPFIVAEFALIILFVMVKFIDPLATAFTKTPPYAPVLPVIILFDKLKLKDAPFWGKAKIAPPLALVMVKPFISIESASRILNTLLIPPPSITVRDGSLLLVVKSLFHPPSRVKFLDVLFIEIFS